MQGLVHIYTGDGKGKTTAALGLALRAAGTGKRVKMIQFLKDTPCGELESAKLFDEKFEILRFQRGRKGFIWEMNEEEIDELKKETHEGLKNAAELSKNGECDVLILDEIFGCLGNCLITEDELINIIKEKNDETELVLTGRNAPEKVCALAHYVSEIRAVKHPLYSGIPAREGIEF